MASHLKMRSTPMKKKIIYTDEPLGDIQVVDDFLPSPDQFIFKGDKAKVADRARRPGEVASDKQAFHQILLRLEGDVGTILQLILKSKEVGFFPNTAPF